MFVTFVVRSHTSLRSYSQLVCASFTQRCARDVSAYPPKGIFIVLVHDPSALWLSLARACTGLKCTCSCYVSQQCAMHGKGARRMRGTSGVGQMTVKSCTVCSEYMISHLLERCQPGASMCASVSSDRVQRSGHKTLIYP
jgi:hypothetical protein